MKIAGLQKVTLLDFPRRVAATVFLAGCNLRCGFCHNRWMIDARTVVPSHTVEQFLAWLSSRQGLLDGVCVSGGEPTLWGDELAELLREIKALGFETKLDTNGLLPDVLAALLARQLVDYVAMDVKAPLDQRYDQLAGVGVDLEKIKASMRLLREQAPAFEFRTTVAPELDEQDLNDLAACLERDDPWYLQAYLETPQIEESYRGQAYLGEDELSRIAGELRAEGYRVALRGEA